MQATQSTNAEGKRAFPSPFTAPIQAARRLMERQQQDVRQQEDGKPPEALLEAAGVDGAISPDGLTGNWCGKVRYDEAAIVASLDAGLASAESDNLDDRLEPDCDLGVEPSSSGEVWRLAHDQIGQSFDKPPLVSLGLDLRESRGPDLRWERGPDPNAVRAAISRLARESQLREGKLRTAVAKKAAASVDGMAFQDVAQKVWARISDEGLAAYGEGIRASSECVAANDAAARPPLTESLASPLAQTAAPGSSAVEGEATRSTGAAFADALSGPALCDLTDASNSAVASAAGDSERGTSGLVSAEAGECLAHDAGNLLSAMRLYSELLCLSGVLQERHRHYADDLKLLAARSQSLIDRLLTLGKRLAQARVGDSAVNSPHESLELRDVAGQEEQSDGTQLTPSLSGPLFSGETHECTDLAAVLDRIGNVLRTVAHGALVIDLGRSEALPVPVGVEPLERILVNLVSNAAVAVQKNGGAIRIRATVQPSGRESAGTMVLTVDDSGCGMSPVQVNDALGRNGEARSDSAEANAPRRRGLGLRIVRELVAASAGKLSLASEPGIGTRVEICWPMLVPHARQQQTTRPSIVAAVQVSNPSVPLRKPVAASEGGERASGVSRIRAGSVAGSEGAIAC